MSGLLDGKIQIVQLDEGAKEQVNCRDVGALEVGIEEDAGEMWLKEHHVSLHGGRVFAEALRNCKDDEQALTQVALDFLAQHLASHPGSMRQFLEHYKTEVEKEHTWVLENRLQETLLPVLRGGR